MAIHVITTVKRQRSETRQWAVFAGMFLGPWIVIAAAILAILH